ncbi:alpha-amylase family glycosyl hydrolase [Kordiimonas lacus]|uniref:Glycosidase n=1 Tax=Kordiimonas lacus TaxID=637679 RepID=A0A1G7A644_9PROT|nr:alpha-amylase family glycosyl hydrolase [Kordiimonas lacus]SDE10282.1 Glycosidase [Kordiimonas lacus]
MGIFRLFFIGCLAALAAASLTSATCSSPETEPTAEAARTGKPVVYQVFTRLFGNQNTTNKPWGTRAENGVGKFADFTDEALEGIRELGVSHVWYTGVLHHGVIADYSAYGISNDDPDVIKGRAGSPYAVKDYYSVDPDLATDPARRMDEFRALVDRTHKHDLKVIIDIIPNHVARGYTSLGKPAGVEDFGAADNTSLEYARDNNFYYVPGEAFEVPDFPAGYEPLGGEAHPLADGKFAEKPAKWTGNGARSVKPSADDWYETVKLNYGVRPDGSRDFPSLPEGYADRDYPAHAAFWADKDLPDTWLKMRDVAFFWLDQGVDGFRYDVAELVPVEFWSFLNSAIKTRNPDAFLLAEVYNPKLYRDYVHLGKMDVLYDKVGLYDLLKAIIQGRETTDALPREIASLSDIEAHMMHFLENHDEQRIASPEFAGSPWRAMPAMVVSATLRTSPTMLYFGQAVGEDGSEDAGFGDPSRTSIFDYIGVPAHQRWMNGGKFDGGALTADEANLRAYYERVMTFSATSSALMGEYQELHSVNRQHVPGYTDQLFAFARWSGAEKLLVIANFSDTDTANLPLLLPSDLVANWGLTDGTHRLGDQLGGGDAMLVVQDSQAMIDLTLEPLQSMILQLPRGE